jgi:hypothetical protein
VCVCVGGGGGGGVPGGRGGGGGAPPLFTTPPTVPPPPPPSCGPWIKGPPDAAPTMHGTNEGFRGVCLVQWVIPLSVTEFGVNLYVFYHYMLPKFVRGMHIEIHNRPT